LAFEPVPAFNRARPSGMVSYFVLVGHVEIPNFRDRNRSPAIA